MSAGLGAPARPGRAGRGLDGLLVVDKPPGPTSHDVVAAARRIAGERRVGHAGTLDPLATGVLPLVLGAATRFVRFLGGDPKVYEVEARLGVETATGDVQGEPLGPWCEPRVDDSRLEQALTALRGSIEQVPPVFSAKKVGGQRLFRLARRGAAPVPRAIAVTVHELTLVARTADTLALRVACSPGTYVRSLVVDLGRMLGTGATVAALRRTRSGDLRIEDAIALDALADRAAVAAAMVPLDQMALLPPRIEVAPEQAAAFRAGRAIPVPPGSGELVSVRTMDGRFLGIGERILGTDGSTAVQPRVVRPAGLATESS